MAAPRAAASLDTRALEARSPEAHASVLFVAVVHTVKDVCFAAAAATRHELIERLAAYVRRHARDQLWPEGAYEVRTLLDRGELDAAVERYFELVGGRWDKEWLVTATADAGAPSAARAALDRAVLPPRVDGSRGVETLRQELPAARDARAKRGHG